MAAASESITAAACLLVASPDISLSLLPQTRPRKRRQAAALQTERRPDSVECGSLLPLSSTKRLAVAKSVGAQHAAPAAAQPTNATPK